MRGWNKLTTNQVVTVFSAGQTVSGLKFKAAVPAWVDCENRMKNDGTAVFRDDRFDVRIELCHLREVAVGDYLFFGRAEAGCVDIDECFRISAVKKNGYGSNPHWHIRTEYTYR